MLIALVLTLALALTILVLLGLAGVLVVLACLAG